MHVKLLLLDKMQTVELAVGEEVGYLFAVLASVDVKDQFFPCEDVVFIEGTTGLLLCV